MPRILLDENFNRRILIGLIEQLPNLDYLIAQETEMEGSTDLDLLAWAAANQRWKNKSAPGESYSPTSALFALHSKSFPILLIPRFLKPE